MVYNMLDMYVAQKKTPFHMFPSFVVAEKSPVELINYLEGRITFIMPTRAATVTNIPLFAGEVAGTPSEILGIILICVL